MDIVFKFFVLWLGADLFAAMLIVWTSALESCASELQVMLWLLQVANAVTESGENLVVV